VRPARGAAHADAAEAGTGHGAKARSMTGENPWSHLDDVDEFARFSLGDDGRNTAPNTKLPLMPMAATMNRRPISMTEHRRTVATPMMTAGRSPMAEQPNRMAACGPLRS
jgi:hypothetical protein